MTFASVLGDKFVNDSTARQTLAYGFVPEYLIQEADYNDFNSYTAHGIFSIQSAYVKANAPSTDSGTVNHGFLMNFAWEKSRSVHVFFAGFPQPGIYMRYFSGSDWGSWVKI